MARRFLALALSAVILGAPVATAVCEATCAASDVAHPGATAGGTHHSCHEQTPPSGTALTAAAHPCGHLDQLPLGRDQGRNEPAAAPAVVPIATFAGQPIDVIVPSPVRIKSSPPSFVALAAPLRL